MTQQQQPRHPKHQMIDDLHQLQENDIIQLAPIPPLSIRNLNQNLAWGSPLIVRGVAEAGMYLEGPYDTVFVRWSSMGDTKARLCTFTNEKENEIHGRHQT
jgi:hypothetical protein